MLPVLPVLVLTTYVPIPPLPVPNVVIIVFAGTPEPVILAPTNTVPEETADTDNSVPTNDAVNTEVGSGSVKLPRSSKPVWCVRAFNKSDLKY
jgi:hypothetical protein